MSATGEWFSDPGEIIATLRDAQPAAPAPPAINGYEDLIPLHRGGQGIVYAGVQRSTRRRVAIKVLLDGALATETARRRFDREIDVAASLRHPNIVRIFDSGMTADGRRFLVMEHIEGQPLDEFLKHKRVDVLESQDVSKQVRLDVLHEIVETFITIADAVNYAHQRGVIHRDLKPSNVRVDTDGRPHVLDFGLAKTLQEQADISQITMSSSGQFLGSLPWASPEQAQGDLYAVDVRSDVYSLGVMLYHAVAGQFPYDVTSNLRTALNNIMNAAPESLREHCPAASGDLETIIGKALHKDPERRYQTAGELAGDLRRYLNNEPIIARADSTWYTMRKTLQRYRKAAIAVGVLLVAAVAVAIIMSALYVRATDAEENMSEAYDQVVVAEREARIEAERNETINEFYSNMLLAADPDMMGRDVTVREVLHRAMEDLDAGGLDDQPLVRAALHTSIGWSFLTLGDYDESRTNVEAARIIYEAEFGPNHEETINAWDKVLEVRLLQADLDGFEHDLRQLIDRATQSLGPDHQLTMRGQSKLARYLRRLSRYDEAEKTMRDLLEQQQRTLGADHNDTLANMNNLAIVLYNAGKAEEALTMMTEVRDRRIERDGADDSQALECASSVASILVGLGRSAEAEPLLRDLIVRTEDKLGPEHPDSLIVKSELAEALRRQGKIDEAMPLLEEVVEGRRAALGEDHPHTMMAINGLAVALEQSGRSDEAEPLHRRMLTYRRDRFGPQHVDTLTSQHNLVNLLIKQDRIDEIAAEAEDYLEQSRAFYGDDHPDLIWALNEVLKLRIKQGRLDDAIALGREALAMVEKHLPPDHPHRAWMQTSLARALLEAGDFAEAEEHLLAAYAFYEQTHSAEHDDALGTAGMLVDLYHQWSKHDLEQMWAIRAKVNVGH